MDQIHNVILKNFENYVEISTGAVKISDSRARRNNPLNVVAKQRVETHEMELLSYRSMLEALYAQNQSSLSWESHCFFTNLCLNCTLLVMKTWRS